VRIETEPAGVPIQPGLACVTAHDHHPELRWQRNFQVRGDLVRDDEGWSLLPRRLIGGFELPPTSTIARYRANMSKVKRFRRIAKREVARRQRA
jgi:hypothetical protein